MELITIPSSKLEIIKTLDMIDGFIVGLKNMCVNISLELSLEEISELDVNNKSLFVLINKNIHNEDLDKIEYVLTELNNYKIKGVLFYDIAVLSIYNRLGLKYDMYWFDEHKTTNFETINYWVNHNIKGVYLSNDITKIEINEILDNVNCKIMLNLFGYLPMFVSKRHIIKNYFDYFKTSNEYEKLLIKKENKIYPIIDKKVGTFVYSNNILNGIKYFFDFNVDYIVLNSFNIDLDKFIKVIEIFKSVNKNNLLEQERKINSIFLNTDYGFLEKNTIYRVKKNEQ